MSIDARSDFDDLPKIDDPDSGRFEAPETVTIASRTPIPSITLSTEPDPVRKMSHMSRKNSTAEKYFKKPISDSFDDRQAYISSSY